MPEAIVGAGTVLIHSNWQKSLKQVHSLQLARADRAAAESCYRRDYSSDSGDSTVSELMLGMDYGLKEFKFFRLKLTAV